MADNYLKIDDDALSQAQKKYAELSSDMVALKDKLETAVSGLKSGWNSDGGDAFFKKFNDQWIRNIQDYSDVIEHMSFNVQMSNSKYLVIFEEAKRLKLK